MTSPTPAEAFPQTTRRQLEDFVTQFAARLAQDDEPDLDAIDVLARITASLAALIDARTASMIERRRRP
jgi:hypothetical protein